MGGGFKEVLARRLKERGWTYEDLARKVGVTGVYISKIVQGKSVPKDDKVMELAKALDLDLERLILLAHWEKAPVPVKPIFERLSRHGAGEFLGEVSGMDNIEVSVLGHGRAVPVVGMVQAGAFMASEDGEYPAGASDAVVYSDQKAANLFAVKVVNDSMEPEFREGDVLIVNPNLEAKSGDYVIAKLKEENEATFKKLIIHGDKGGGKGSKRLVILRPLNARYEDIVVTDPSKLEIVGRVVERKTLF
ncbi:MAG TPA: XRE family transcriptional regulator [bacterium]|nr:XRE family transcriptional regulator [bacterium]